MNGMEGTQKKLATTQNNFTQINASTVNRTQGLKIFSLALSQLSYRGWYEHFLHY